MKTEDIVLVISWWWFKSFYALWILKAIEELWIKDRIKACYWVSWWAITLSFWLSWYSAEEIYNIWSDINYLKVFSPNLKIPKSLIPNDVIYEIFNKYLKKDISDLDKKLYIGATDLKTWKYKLFSSWVLSKILFWSMSIRWVFPWSKYRKMFLFDGGVLDNFPVKLAKDKHKNEQILWILLNKIEKDDEISWIKNILRRSFHLVLDSNVLGQIKYVDILFHNKIWIWVLEFNKKKFKDVFEKWYKDWLAKLS